jgi:ArsR family transcriptional regulator
VSRDHQNETTELLRLLAHPIRRAAINTLGAGEQPVGHLARRLDVAPAHLSQQLAILRRSGLVRRRRQGSMVYYAVADHRLADLLRVADEIAGTPMPDVGEGGRSR